ncbi:hypothetical protein PRZ61_12235 [Halomonas pacifica]|uniref:hypothetical protein n=1 Tax=Bisbaumannia pacifica TaxID=77098 RepID=UPI002359A635|nr:hypothetical protein [Halomonas pacifica]MDC8804210.1 hypothetical protein [Halomonas pacifica]
MRFGFINAFSVQLGATLAEGATTATLEPGVAVALDDASADRVYPLVLAERDVRGIDVRREIIYVTGRSGDDVTIQRARETTTDQEWPAGTVVEYRLTEGALEALVQQGDSPVAGVAAQSQVTVAIGPLDLLSGADTAVVSLPAGLLLFADSVDIVVADSDSPGGAPEVEVGEDATNNDTLLASTAVTVTAPGERQVEAPATPHGVASLRAATTVAGTGTTLTAWVVVRGYVMEL